MASAARVSRTVLSRMEQGKARAEQMCRLEANRSRHLRPAVALASDALAAEPLIARAQERVELWRTQRSCSPRYIEAWAQALNRPPAGVALAMTMASSGTWRPPTLRSWSRRRGADACVGGTGGGSGEAGLQRPVNSRSIRSTPRCHGGSSSPKAARSRAVSSREFRGRCAGVG